MRLLDSRAKERELRQRAEDEIEGSKAGRGGLPHPGRAAAGDRLHRRAGRARALALRQPPGRGDPRLHPGGVARRSGAVGQQHPPRGPRARDGAGDREDRRDPQPAPGRLPDADPRRRRRSGSSTRRCWSSTPRASPSGTASSTTSPSARSPSRDLERARRPAGGGRAARGAGALGRRPGGPDGLDRRSLMAEIEGVEHACVWELPQSGRPPATCAPGSRSVHEHGEGRASATRNSHAGAAVESGLHVIVDDWETESRFAMPPALRVLGIRSSLAVVIDGKKRPLRRPRRALDRAPLLHPARTCTSSSPRPTCSPTRSSAACRRRRSSATGSSTTPSPASPTGPCFVDTLDRGAGPRRRLGRPGRGPLPRPRPLQADQRQPRPPRGRRAAAGGRAAPALPPAPRRRRRPLRRRRVRDPGRAARRRARGGGDRRARRQRPSTDPFQIGGVEHFVTASVGIAVAGPRRARADADSLIRDADAAMYRAKERGRGRCELFDAEMRAGAVRRLEVERELRHALERDELVLHYQPIVALRNRRDHRGRGAAALAAPRARPARPGRVHPGRRGERPDRADRALGAWSRPAARPSIWHARAPRRAPARRLGQPLGPPGRPPRPHRRGRRDPRPHRPRPRAPAPRDHRERPGRGVGASPPRPWRR